METHHITTEDGYHLTLHRIPSQNSTKSKPILLVHPLTTFGIFWVISFATHAKPFAFQLSDHGFDIWIIHHRGTPESLEHEILTTSDANYWNFTLHELAVYDIGNCIDYILKQTRSDQIGYLGYSQGSTCLLILVSSKKEFNDKISTAFLIASVASFKHVPSSVRALISSQLLNLLFDFMRSSKMYYFALSDERFNQIQKYVLSNQLLVNIAFNGISLILGNFAQPMNYVSIIPKVILN